MKKKLALISLIMIACTLIVSGTLAFFRDDNKVENTFTYGEIKIEQFEQEHNSNGDLVDFTQNQYLYPVVNVNDPTSDKHYVEKLVSLKNIGTNDAYVRTFIAVPSILNEIIHLDINESSKWIRDDISWPTTSIEGIEYKVISFTYDSSISKDETTDYVLEGVYMDSTVDLQLNETVNTKQFCIEQEDGTYKFFDYDVNNQIQVYVVSQGCQTRGLSNNPIEAINTAFQNSMPAFE